MLLRLRPSDSVEDAPERVAYVARGELIRFFSAAILDTIML